MILALAINSACYIAEECKQKIVSHLHYGFTKAFTKSFSFEERGSAQYCNKETKDDGLIIESQQY